MRAGEMDRTIIIEQKQDVRQSAGGNKMEWLTFATLAAKVTETPGNEQYRDEQNQGFQTTKFKIYFRPGIKDEMRINYGGKFYDILGKKELGRREGIEIVARARIN